ncbi:hypothetical protein FNYG_15089 [Fusarium nygamai]|uniref:2EXR domain-containing protein n=1 Tax=Gibberella nygamai TaxID=42673 RepID=A0A2K0UKY2_GIBNY|nr:hypothetical protein FNYG_15089 [Fusarium nygamai]
MTQPMVVEDPDHAVGLKQTEEMPALPASEIPATAFHRFPNFPAELRLKIWKAACFPYAADQRGLHYIDLENLGGDETSGDAMTDIKSMEMKALHPDFQTSLHEQRVVRRPNRSVYMWDAGLWKACRESRKVISTHFQLKLCRSTQNNDLDPLKLDECLSKACRPYPSEWYFEPPTSHNIEELSEKRPDHEDSVHECEPFLPTCLLFRNQEHVERFMVMPTRNLFCIKNPRRYLLPLTLDTPRLHVPYPNGKKIVLRHSFNIVLEFDTSWLDHFPKSWEELKTEESPRGLFAGWAETCMAETSRGGGGDVPCIYLLNKAARWAPHWWVKDDVVFYDCDDAYVEVNNDYRGFYPAESADASPMLTFLWKLWTLAFCDYCTDERICDVCHHVPGFDLTEFVKVLVRHEEEPARGQIENRVDELDELDNGSNCDIEHENEDGEEGKETSGF